jgi:hypothetical protein
LEAGEAHSEAGKVKLVEHQTGGFAFDFVERATGLTDAEIEDDLQRTLRGAPSSRIGMFKRSTLFIVGAGARCEVGLRIGSMPS